MLRLQARGRVRRLGGAWREDILSLVGLGRLRVGGVGLKLVSQAVDHVYRYSFKVYLFSLAARRS